MQNLCRNEQTALVRKTVYISLGSNVGDREQNLRHAIEHLRKLGEAKAVSSVYETEPVEYTAQPWFLNAVVALETDLMPRQFMSRLLGIEKEMGRRRTVAKGPRVIDLDVIFFGHSVIDAPEITVPHPAMHERRFVLEPLAEIAPELRHPVFKKTVREMRDALAPGAAVKRLR